MDRRTYLSVTATAALASIAGCQGSESDTEDDDTEAGTPEDTPAGETVLAWREWIPAGLVIGTDAQVMVLDTNRAKAELPAETYTEFQLGQIANALDISESNIDRMAGVQRGENTSDIVLTGSYNPAQVVDALNVEQSNVERYEGYQVVQDQFAIGSSAIVVSTNYETLIDTKAGAQPYLGQNDEEWNRLLTSIQDATLGVGTAGTLDDDPTIDASKSGVTINAADGSGARISIYVHYESESAAKEAMDTAREEFVSGATGNDDVDIERFDREGSRIIIEGTTPNFSFTQ